MEVAMQVQDIMVHPVITTNKSTLLNEVAALMLKHQIGCVPVVNDYGELLGMITETDFMPRWRNLPFSTFRMPYLLGHFIPMEGLDKVTKEVGKLTAEDLMSPSVSTAKEEDTVDDLIASMLEKKINHVPVLRNKTLVGIVARHDILQAFLQQTRRLNATTH
jgi:CBS domain-containing protein